MEVLNLKVVSRDGFKARRNFLPKIERVVYRWRKFLAPLKTLARQALNQIKI